MTAVDIDDYRHCIAQMDVLPETFKAIEGNVMTLSGISASLLEEKKIQEGKKSKDGLIHWKWILLFLKFNFIEV